MLLKWKYVWKLRTVILKSLIIELIYMFECHTCNYGMGVFINWKAEVESVLQTFEGFFKYKDTMKRKILPASY